MLDLPAGTYHLVAEAVEGTASTDVTLQSGEERAEVIITLAPRASVRGRIVSLERSEPVAGVTVSAFSQDTAPTPGTMPEHATTDEAGQFVLRHVAHGPVMIAAMPVDPRGSPWDAAFVPFDLQSDTDNDAGDIALARRRLARDEHAGDVGYRLASSPGFASASMLLEVATVRPAGPAALAGLAEGDVIITVDGYDVTGPRRYLHDTLTRIPPGTSVTLGLARGSAISVEAGEAPAVGQ